MPSRRLLLSAAIAFLAAPALAEEPPIYEVSNLAIRGFDPVAYFTQGGPIEGKESIQLMWMGATWRFSSVANREAFERNPQKFAPQYGGYCAYAASRGYAAASDPEIFALYDGKLYLTHSAPVRGIWERDKAQNVSKADANWPKPLKD